MMPVASDFLERLLVGRNVLHRASGGRDTRPLPSAATLRERWSRRCAEAFEGVDQSPLVLGEAAGPLPAPADGHGHSHG